MEQFMLLVLRQSLLVAVAGLVILWLLNRNRSPTVHRVCCALLLLQGWLLCHGALPTSSKHNVVGSPASVDSDSLIEILRASTGVAVERPANSELIGSTSATGTSAGEWLPPFVKLFSAVAPTLFWIWLVGICAIVGLNIWQYVRFLRALNVFECTNASHLAAWQLALLDCGMEEPIPLLLTENFGPAVLCRRSGLALVVPVGFLDSLSTDQRNSVLVHEAKHLQRHDIWKSLLTRLLVLPQWFNPVAWMSVRRFDEAAEWACDEDCRKVGPKQAVEYARTLLEQMEPTQKNPVLVVGMRGRNMMPRIQRLLFPERIKDSRMRVLTTLAVILAATCFALFEPWTTKVNAQQKQSTKDTSILQASYEVESKTGQELIDESKNIKPWRKTPVQARKPAKKSPNDSIGNPDADTAGDKVQIMAKMTMFEVQAKALHSLDPSLISRDRVSVSIESGLLPKLQALRKKGKAKVTASPTVVTHSGQSANLHCGGEFPVVTPATEKTVAIEYRPFGLFCDVTPTSLGDGRISTDLTFETSTRDFRNSVEVGGVTIPGIIARKLQSRLEVTAGSTIQFVAPVELGETENQQSGFGMLDVVTLEACGDVSVVFLTLEVLAPENRTATGKVDDENATSNGVTTADR